MPVTVPIPDEASATLTRRPVSAVFTGGLAYQPNLDALRAYVKDIIPAFYRRGIEPPRLSVIGAAPKHLRATVEHPTIEFLGYVPSVTEELMKHQVFFAPIVSGTGIKTKVLEAMACGLPVVGLEAAVTGLAGAHQHHYLVADGPDDFVTQFIELRDDPERARRIAEASRSLAISLYSLDASTRILGQAMASLAWPRDREGVDELLLSS